MDKENSIFFRVFGLILVLLLVMGGVFGEDLKYKIGDTIVTTDEKENLKISKITEVTANDLDWIYITKDASIPKSQVKDEEIQKYEKWQKDPAQVTPEYTEKIIKAGGKLNPEGIATVASSLTLKQNELTATETAKSKCANGDETCQSDATRKINNLKTEISNLNKAIVNVDQNSLGEAILSENMDKETKDKLVKMAVDKKCGTGILGGLCSAFDFTTVNDLKIAAANNKFSEITKNNMDEDGKWAVSAEEHNKKIEEVLKENAKDWNDGQLGKWAVEGYDKFNCGGEKDCTGEYKIEKYQDYLDDYDCNNDKGCEDAIDSNLALTEAAEKKVANTYDATAYGILSSLINPDKRALSAAKMFGFEADYTNVPSWLKNEQASSICLGSIDGYIEDDTQSYAGGVTKYETECRDYDKTKDSSKYNDPNCVLVTADLRAQRTRITPDNTTILTYSYYLLGPSSKTAEYIVALSYTKNGVVVKEALFEKKSVEKNAQATGFDTLQIELNDTQGIDENSFKVTLGAFVDRVAYIVISAPVVPLSSGDAYNDVYGKGNTQGNIEAKDGEGLSENSLLDLI